MNSEFSSTRRSFLQAAAWTTGLAATGAGSWLLSPTWANAAEGPIKVGIATDLTGPLGFAGIANANVAKLVVQEINDNGGLLGRPIELHIEDTATNEAVGVGNVRKLIQRDKVDVVLGGILSSMRNAIKDAIITRGKTLYIYPANYEGKECTPNLFCTGPTPPQQCDQLIPWLVKNGGKRFALPGSDYIFPRTVIAYARKVIEANGGEVVFDDYFPPDQVEYGPVINKIMTEKIDVVFNMIIPPGIGPFIKGLAEAGFLKRGGRLGCTFYDDSLRGMIPTENIEGLASCQDYYRAVTKTDPGSAKIQAAYDKAFPGAFLTGSTGSTGMYRGLKLWEAAVKEAGKVELEAVAAALDHAKIAEGPGGPAEVVPGKRHCRMNMYTAVAKNGEFEVVDQSKGLADPREC